MGNEKVGEVLRGGDGFTGEESPCARCGLRCDLGQETGTSAVQKLRKMGKNREDEYMIISYTKERSKKKPGFGHSCLARRPAAGLMKHLRCGTFASATKKMCSGSADVPGPPEQNNDIITISVTDQTVHKVTGEGRPVRHTQGGLAMAHDGCGLEACEARQDHLPPELALNFKSQGQASTRLWWVFANQSQLLLISRNLQSSGDTGLSEGG